MRCRGTEEREYKSEIGTWDGRYIIVHHIKTIISKRPHQILVPWSNKIKPISVRTGVGLLSGQLKTSSNN